MGVADVQAETAGVGPQGVQQGDGRCGVALLNILEGHRHTQGGEAFQPRLPESSRSPHPGLHALRAAEVGEAAQVQNQMFRPQPAAELQGVPHPPAGGLQDQVVPAGVAQVQKRAMQMQAALRVPAGERGIETGPVAPIPR